MQVTPVKRYPEPDFPTYAILYEHPELLRLVPKRWRGNPLVLAALAGVCTILWGCRSVSRADESRGDSKSGKSHPVSLVAPIFQHGEGRGAFGCVAIAAPAFLSEEEARQVVRQETREAGMSFVREGETLPRVSVPETDRFGSTRVPDVRPEGPVIPSGPPVIGKRLSGPIPLTLDGTDTKRLISYEFVSQADFTAWETSKHKQMSSVSVFDLQGTATGLRDGLVEAKPEGVYAVFYDPVIYYNGQGVYPRPKARGAERRTQDDWKAASTEAKNNAREELRKQVRDFIAWLKAQGVI